jgi:ABC-type phosphate transport system permease subunit
MDTVDTIISRIGTYIINPLLLVMFSFGFVVFMYGLLEFMWSANKGENTNTGKSHMLWGTVGMVIMVSVYGIIALLDNTFNLQVSNPNYNPQDITVSHNSIFGN